MGKSQRFFIHTLVSLLLFCLPVTVNGAEKVTLQLKWFHQFQFAGYYAAKEQGFYAEEGLDVEFRQRDVKTSYIDDVLEGKAQYGTSDAGLLFSRMQGEPVVVLAQIFQHSPLVLLTLKESGLRTAYQLAGKKVMIDTLSYSDAPANGMLFKVLGSFDQFEPVRMSFRYEDLSEKKVDAIAAYVTDQPFKFQEAGIDVNVLDPRDYGIDFYGDNLFTTEKEIREHPQRVERMIRATLKGWHYALEHKEEMVDLILEQYNPQKLSREHLLYEAEQTAKMIVPRFVELGTFEPSRFTKIAEIYAALELTEKTSVDPNFLYTPVRALIDLTPEERTWLAAHPKIVVGGETDWAPFDFVDENGKHTGIAADYLEIIGQKLGLEMEMVTGPSWDELLGMLRRQEIDVLPAIYHAAEREAFLDFTSPYLQITEFIFSRSDNATISGFKDLEDKTTVVVKGYTIENDMREQHPDYKLITAPTIQEALHKLVRGEADAFIGDIVSTSYNIKELSLVGLKPIAQVPIRGPQVHMAVRKDWPILKGLIDKVLAAIPAREHAAIKDKWIARAEQAIAASHPDVALTAEERAWIEQHPVIRVSSEPDYAPFDFIANGKSTGFSVDYVNLVAERAGLRLEYVQDTWKNLVEKGKRKEIDLLHTIFYTPERAPFFHYTQPYKTVVNGIFVRDGVEGVASLQDLAGRRVIIAKGDSLAAHLPQLVPEADFVFMDTYEEILKSVSLGQGDATVMDIAVVHYLIRKLTLTNIRPAGEARVDIADHYMSYRLAVRKDWPELQSILQKAMDTVTPDEMTALEARWFALPAFAADGIALSPEERQWLRDNPVIRVHNEKDWPPFNYFEFDRPRGLSIDYMDRLAVKLGLEVEYVTGPSWNEFLDRVKRKELDVMLNIVKTEDRQKYLLYTDPYVKNPNVIVSATKNAYAELDELFGKVVAFPKGFFYEEVLTKSFPQIERLPVEDTLASLKAVAYGRADAAIGEAAVIQTLINRNMLVGLQISGEVELGNPDLANLRIGVRNDWPLLQSALMKAMATITPQEMDQIREKWLVGQRQPPDGKAALPAETQDRQARLSLSPEEHAWLTAHTTIRFTGDPDWLPQEAFTSEGQYIGIVADILDLLETRIGIRFDRVAVKTWEEALRLAEAGEVDVLSETSNSERDTLLFTEPYLAFPVVIMARQGTPPIPDPGELQGRRLAVVKDYGYVVPFRRQFPDLNYVVVDTVRDGLRRLAAGEVDAFISAAPTAYYLMSELGLMNLRIVGSTGISLDLGFGVRQDMPLLVTILNKALASITEEEKFKIRQKWVPVTETSGPQTAATVSYRRLLIYGIAVFLALSLLAWILIRSIRRENIAVSFGSSWFRGLVLAGLSVFVLIVAFVGWYMLERNKAERLRSVDESLRGTLSVSEDRFELWMKERVSYLARLGRDPELVAITQRLLQVPQNKRALLASSALREARFFFQNTADVFGNIGFFVIDQDHVSIGSMRDANLGTRNLIAEQHPALLQQAFGGQVGFVPPITSDVNLGKSSEADNARKPPTMFFIGPVQDADGQVLAVMTLRVDPWQDFARALNSFGGGESRESYAFDRNGVMLSSSWFEDQLRQIGLLTEDQTSALNIEIRDPGGNMVEGYRSGIERSQQPLTQMASRAIALRQQMESAGIREGPSPVASNIEGYRDYRGVPVFGAWLWNTDLDIGLAVEVDVAEALSSYYRTRATIFTILGFTLLLSVGAILFVLIIGERTSRALMRARDSLEARVDERTAELQEKQKQLAEAEERARMLLDSAGEGIFGVDVEGKLAFINPAACRLLGYEPAELIGEGIHAKVHYAHPDGSAYPREDCPMYRSCTEGTRHLISDEVLWRQDGTSFPVEYTSMPLHKDGQVVGAVVTFMDITERKRMEANLADEQKRLQSILDTSPVAVGIAVEGVIQYANERLAEYMGLKKGDRAIAIYVNPDDRDVILKEIENKGAVRNYELKVYNAKGAVRDMLSNYNLIEYEGQTAVLGWWTDVTDIKATSDELKTKFDELARFRRIAIGREQKMIELKKEINDLFKANGASEKYKIH